MVCLMGREIR